MAIPEPFPGSNCTYEGDGDSVADLDVFRNQTGLVSCWRLSPEEIEEINRTGVLFLMVSGHRLPPVFVGSHTEVRAMAADGGLWRE